MDMHCRRYAANRPAEAGNILIYVLIGVILIGVLTATLRSSGDPGKDLDGERMGIKATQVQRYAAQISQGVTDMLRRGISEGDLRFAHPKALSAYGTITTTPEAQVFHPSGGNVEYQTAPAGVGTGTRWEFYGNTSIPQIGSDKADLIAVLPNVSKEFCLAVNRQIGFKDDMIPIDALGGTPSCLAGTSSGDYFTGTFSSSPNLPTASSFNRLPSAQGCIRCRVGSSGEAYHYYYVLIER